MKDLEKTDITILRMLLKDGRKSFTSIARECDTSSDVVWAHYNELKRTGIIVGATTQFNYQKFGYTGLAAIMLSVEPQSLEEVFDRISRFPNILAYRYYNSVYNIWAVSILKNLNELERIKQGINKQSEINEFKTFLWTDCRNTPENILGCASEAKKLAISTQTGTQKPPVIDEIDMKIIDALTINGRLAFRKLAEQIGISTTTIARRYENLEKNNYIKVSIQINPLELGFQNILEISLAIRDQREINETADKLSRIPGVSYLVKISGTFDLSVTILVKDCRSIVDVNDQIIKIPNIKRMEAALRPLPSIWPGQRQYISTF